MSDAVLGFAGVVIAVFFFGSNFLPLKNIKIGDGVFFQFCMCNGIFITSIPILIFQSFPPIHGIALLGGFLWTTGNMFVPVAIRFIGMGLGLILWGCVSMLIGWASGKFGLFGLKKQEIGDPVMNYIGVFLSIVGLILYVQVKTVDTSVDAKAYAESVRNQLHTPQSDMENRISSDTSALSPTSFTDSNKIALLPLDHHSDNAGTELLVASRTPVEQTASFGDDWSEGTKRTVGLSLALLAGVFFGLNFDPAQYVIDNKYDGDDNSLNYVFSHYLGILITSWFYTVAYCVYCQYHKVTPYVKAEIFLPATLSGIMWGIAEAAYFLANGKLGFPVSFPMISAGPGFVGAAYGVFYFKEITGTDNLRMLAAAMCVTIPALVLVGVSH
jgi:glucose uptake protein GlcU